MRSRERTCSQSQRESAPRPANQRAGGGLSQPAEPGRGGSGGARSAAGAKLLNSQIGARSASTETSRSFISRPATQTETATRRAREDLHHLRSLRHRTGPREPREPRTGVSLLISFDRIIH
ncbi:hypothetical protein SRHO_G00294520 [Serrasalmus rhombeus]